MPCPPDTLAPVKKWATGHHRGESLAPRGAASAQHALGLRPPSAGVPPLRVPDTVASGCDRSHFAGRIASGTSVARPA
jgi:hypothetical protein